MLKLATLTLSLTTVDSSQCTLTHRVSTGLVVPLHIVTQRFHQRHSPMSHRRLVREVWWGLGLDESGVVLRESKNRSTQKGTGMPLLTM